MLDTRIQYIYQPKHVDAPPHYATHHAAGLDLTADLEKPIMLHALQRALIPTGVYLTSMPTDCELQIRPRSSLANGAGVTVLNNPGTVDADYVNKADPLDKEIKVLLVNLSNIPYTVEPGSKIAQGVFNEVRHAQQGYEQAQERTGGFGSTDKQVFDNQTDTTRDLWAETYYPLCVKLGLRITPGLGAVPAGIPFDHLGEKLKAAGKWYDWCNWAGDAITSGSNGIYPWDVENFLAGVPNTD